MMIRDYRKECRTYVAEYQRLDRRQMFHGENHHRRMAFLDAKINWLMVVIDHLNAGTSLEDAIVGAHNQFGDEPTRKDTPS